jgi:hypothetical protein
MKRLIHRTKSLIRGTSTAVLVSIGFHAAVIAAGAFWVVFQYIDKKTTKYVPVVVERSKMDLVKPRIKIKETPRQKETERIASTRVAALTDIQLPKMSDVGGKLGDIGGFSVMADMASMTMFGKNRSTGNDLQGNLYDLKRYSNGAPTGLDRDNVPMFIRLLGPFFERNWAVSELSKFYKGPSSLYATQFMVPPTQSDIAPAKFGISENIEPARWVAVYRGKIAHTNDIKFRFVGCGDDFFYVRINGQMVLDGSYSVERKNLSRYSWESRSSDHRKWLLGHMLARVGDWIELKAGEPVEMEVFMAEGPGGLFSAMLLVQVDGVQYSKNDRGDPILPIFKTTEVPPHLVDEIEYLLVPGQATLVGGPIFSVY